MTGRINFVKMINVAFKRNTFKTTKTDKILQNILTRLNICGILKEPPIKGGESKTKAKAFKKLNKRSLKIEQYRY